MSKLKGSEETDTKQEIAFEDTLQHREGLELACELHMEAIKEAGEIITEQDKVIKEMCRDKAYYETIIKALDNKIDRIKAELEREKKIVNKIIGE